VNCSNKQSGMVIVLLVVMLSLLSMVATGALHYVREGYSTAATDPRHILQQSTDLRNARQALLSYTALYPYLYGPGGAGPGHFPCPDLDGRHIRGDIVWALNLGPNPPCGSIQKSSGRLPNHISFSSHRYLVHARLESDIDYQLSDEFVNNPINRLINPAMIQSHASKSEAPVRLRTSIQALGASALSFAGTTLSSTAVLGSAKLSVASWIIQRLNLLYGEVCVAEVFADELLAGQVDQHSLTIFAQHTGS